MAENSTVTATTPVTILYTNYRGETAPRRIILGGRDERAPTFWFGSTKWHPRPQQMFTARDADREVYRDFAFSGVKAWGEEAVSAALASTAGAGARDWVTVPRKVLTPFEEEHDRLLEEAPKQGFHPAEMQEQISWHALAALKEALSAVPASPRSGAGEGEEARLSKIIEAERSMVAIGLNAIRKAIAGRAWLSEAGRGAYAYDDDRYQREFGEALREIEAACEPLRRVARDWSDCPKDRAEILAARAEFSPPAPAEHGAKIDGKLYANVSTQPFICPDCNSRSYSRVAGPDARMARAPSLLIRCVECKAVYRDANAVEFPIPAPVEHGVEIRAISEHQLRELSALADWLERDSSENDADNIRAAVSALSQGGGAGRSEKGEGEERLWDISDQLEEMERDLNEALDEAKNGYASDVPHWIEKAKGRIKAVLECAEVIAGHRLAAHPSAPAQSPSTSDGEG